MFEEPVVIRLPYFHSDEYGTMRDDDGDGGGGGGKGTNEREKQKIKKGWRRQIDEECQKLNRREKERNAVMGLRLLVDVNGYVIVCQLNQDTIYEPFICESDSVILD
jgi:hypothetical protein